MPNSVSVWTTANHLSTKNIWFFPQLIPFFTHTPSCSQQGTKSSRSPGGGRFGEAAWLWLSPGQCHRCVRNTVQKEQEQPALLQTPNCTGLVMWEPHTSTGGEIKGFPGETGNCQRSWCSTGWWDQWGSAWEMCAATSDIPSLIRFESVSFVAQLCGQTRWLGDNEVYSCDLIFVECLLLLLIHVWRSNVAMLRRCQ